MRAVNFHIGGVVVLIIGLQQPVGVNIVDGMIELFRISPVG